jgi:adenine-specific DNA-methyltransferase
LKDDYRKHLIANGVYVLLKRFTSKDEKRRLVAAVHNPQAIPSDLIGFDNKINYVGVLDENLSLVEAYGLAALFNSTFMDKYFRCLSGNTQVNSTEIRVLHFPSRESVNAIGRKIRERKNHNQTTIDEAVNTVLIIDF